jgi:hypothetical protein
MIKRFILGILGASLAFASHAAPDMPAPGQKLTQEQIALWGKLPVYQIGKSQFRALPADPAHSQSTLLINEQGTVGISHNEVAISGVSAETVQAGLRQVVPSPLSIQRFDQAGVTVARYADFAQAVDGLRAIKAALPGAQVRLPVQFGRQVPY